MIHHNINSHNIQSILSKILNAEIYNVTKLGRGRNSLVYHVQSSSFPDCVSKFYFQRQINPIDRLKIEFNSIQYLWNHDIRCIPQALLFCEEYKCGVYSWINGTYFPPQKIRTSEINKIIEFLITLKKLTRLPSSRSLPFASEACLSFEILEQVIEQRIIRLKKCDNSELQHYLDNELQQIYSEILNWSKKESHSLEFDWQKEIPLEECTLSPSDLGFHNAVMSHSGELIFLDFEYFGWDDPSKMISDFLLHPAFHLTPEIREYFLHNFFLNFPNSKHVKQRIHVAYPLHGINWCLRILNSYLYQLEEETELHLLNTQKDQLQKSKRLLQELSNQYSNK